MGKSWHYPRWRRVLMQFTLLLLLAGTVGLAALVSRDRNRQQRYPLTQGVSVGPVRLRLPAHWAVATLQRGGGLLLARPPRGEDVGLRLTGRLFPVTDDRSAEDLLLGPEGILRDEQSAVPETDGPSDAPGIPQAGGSPPTSIIHVGNVPGVLVRLITMNVASPGAPAGFQRWYACGIFSGGVRQALVLELDVPLDDDNNASPDNPGASDPAGDLLRAIAASVQFNAAPLAGHPQALPPV